MTNPEITKKFKAKIDSENPKFIPQIPEISDLGEIKELFKNQGGQSEIWTVCNQEGQIQYLLKIYHRGAKLPNYKTLEKIDSKFVVKPVKTGVYQGRDFEITQFFKGGNLREVLVPKEKKSKEFCLELLKQVSSSLNALHQGGLIHADLKPENILIQRKAEANSYVLCDLGSSKKTEQSQTITQAIGSPLYLSPEMALDSPSKASDFYSLGLILTEALQGIHPLGHLPTKALLLLVASGKKIQIKNLDSNWTELLEGLLDPKIETRWKNQEIQTWIQKQTRTEIQEDIQEDIQENSVVWPHYSEFDEAYEKAENTKSSITWITSEDNTQLKWAMQAFKWCADNVRNDNPNWVYNLRTDVYSDTEKCLEALRTPLKTELLRETLKDRKIRLQALEAIRYARNQKSIKEQNDRRASNMRQNKGGNAKDRAIITMYLVAGIIIMATAQLGVNLTKNPSKDFNQEVELQQEINKKLTFQTDALEIEIRNLKKDILEANKLNDIPQKKE